VRESGREEKGVSRKKREEDVEGACFVLVSHFGIWVIHNSNNGNGTRLWFVQG